ncbi:helix-turn-helix domain-containing protein [Deinococcus petrolearius]|uniref:Helix-turn-helix domain-containing protein n=1 Tax=Deinococcus petrolearius TaxID=1751295 RepID=A0ABW1DLY3_9DEIO
MNPRTPGFTPGRLKLAREVAGLSKADLAGHVGLTSAAIVMYESGARTPGPDILQALSNHLQQPLDFFYRPPPPARHGTVFYRSLKSTERLARIKAQAIMIMLWDAVDYFQGLVELPPVTFPRVGSLPDSPQDITESMVEAAAQIARQHWNLGDEPATNIVWLLEASGAIVMRTDLGNEKLEAMSEWRHHDGRPYVLLNHTKKNAFRSRADIAHELGHLLLHRQVTQEQLDDTDLFRRVEDQAWHFAQCFLLPEQSFLHDAYSTSLDVLLTLKPRWRVSVAFMLQRLQRLEILTGDRYVNARKYLTQRGWRVNEPYDAETIPEQPLVLKQLVNLLNTHRIQTFEQMAQGIGSNPKLLEQIMALEPGTFAEPNPFVIRFSQKQNVG